MKKAIMLVMAVCGLFVATHSNAQVRKIPAEVTDALKAKYPSAKDVEWKDQVTDFRAKFLVGDDKYEAKFNGKGEWKSTEKTLKESELPKDVKEGFDKSKFNDWKVNEIYVLSLPGEKDQYHIVAKNGLEKKNLLFNRQGELVKDNLTL